MRIKNLLLAVLALPLLFVACEENNPIDEVKNPTVDIVAGEATPNSLSFTITSTEADNVAWIVIEATEVVPTASEVLANGTAVEANTSVDCVANELKSNTTYTIVAAVKNTQTVGKKDIQMTTQAKDPDATDFYRTSEAEIEFTAEAGNGTIEYEIVNPVEGVNVEASDDAEWITDLTVVANQNKVTFAVAANDGDSRNGRITVTYGELSFTVWVKQAKAVEQPTETVEFVASDIVIEYYGTEFSSAYNYYVNLSDVGFDASGKPLSNGTYYMLDFYSSVGASMDGGTLPNGTYTLSDSSAAGTIGLGNYGAMIVFTDGTPAYSMYAEGYAVVSDGKIEANIMMEDGEVHHIVYEGDLTFGNGGSPTIDFEATHIADKWLWGGQTTWGNKYQVVGANFSVDVHFQPSKAAENALANGEYTWTTTTMWGYNDFEEFTTRTFTVDGVSVAVDGGLALIESSGEEYHIELTLKGRDGFTYMIEYNGKLNDKGEVSGDGNIVMTSLSEGVYNSSYGWYTFTATSSNVSFDILINDYQSKANSINAASYMYAPMKSLSGSEGYFFVDNFKLDGIKYKPQVNSTMTVTNDGSNVGITLNLYMDSGDEFVVTYNGPVGGSSSTGLTKLATPSVLSNVAGNAATVSWQTIEGAKDYTVTLNGTDVQTVTTAYITYNNLSYATTYSVSVVANPADATVYAASDAGTTSFTTEADPNGGGNEGGNDGGDDEWVGREVRLNLLAYMDNTLYTNFNNEARYLMTNFRDGIVAGKFVLSGDNKSTEILLAGHATSQYGLFGGTESFADGDTVEVINNGDSTYTIVYRITIDGEKITATYNGGLQ